MKTHLLFLFIQFYFWHNVSTTTYVSMTDTASWISVFALTFFQFLISSDLLTGSEFGVGVFKYFFSIFGFFLGWKKWLVDDFCWSILGGGVLFFYHLSWLLRNGTKTSISKLSETYLNMRGEKNLNWFYWLSIWLKGWKKKKISSLTYFGKWEQFVSPYNMPPWL